MLANKEIKRELEKRGWQLKMAYFGDTERRTIIWKIKARNESFSRGFVVGDGMKIKDCLPVVYDSIKRSIPMIEKSLK